MSVAENPISHLQVAGVDEHVLQKFNKRISRGNLTRSEDPYNHLSVYFVVFDQYERKVFIGHHKKSGLWLANGGHMEQGETPRETALREMGEELGENLKVIRFPNEPCFLTVTDGIDNAGKLCRTHYDIWFFVEVDRHNFDPDNEKIAQEFGEMGWFSMRGARVRVTDDNTLAALTLLEEKKMSL
ncbi:MAG TPA: NUDIX domain-containing protein [Candidatus Saccharimonadales bacterium]|nr:NUDIX domain-containing protein [Candidatus Saccharimonadales bacterium]